MSKKVVIDPGHGVGSVNCSPDKSYWEHEFAWDLWQRVKPLLERHGVEVTVTRRVDNKPSLSERCAVANNIAGLDLFVSLHSNAPGAAGWFTGPDGRQWNTARGFLIYTSGPGATAGRNVAANAIIARMREAGVIVRSNALSHGDYTVLSHTKAPAMIIEYGFHTNLDDVALLKSDTYRDLLAVATVKGILDYLGITWVPKKDEEEIDMTKQDVQAMIDEAVQAAKPKAYTTIDEVPNWAQPLVKEAVDAGILRGDHNGALHLTDDNLITLQLFKNVGEF